jgi:pyridoxine kinase
MIDIVLTGHFSSPEQAEFAGWAIDQIKASRRDPKTGIDGDAPVIIVDPILGDEGKGYYVAPRVAQAINKELVDRADLIAPNLWEFSELVQTPLADLRTPEAVAARTKAYGGNWLISSVPGGDGGIGVLYRDMFNTLVAETPRVATAIPNGTGDLLTLRFVGGMANGIGFEDNLALSVGATYEVIRKSVEWNAPELPLAACSDFLANPPRAPVRKIP